MRTRGSAATALMAGLIGVVIGAVLVWALASREVRQGTAVTGGGMLAPLRPVTTSSENAIVSAVRNVGPAVVKVTTQYAPPAESPAQRALRELFRLPRPFPGKGEGSGIIIDARSGYILTNAHVVKSAGKVRVTLSDKRQFDARVVGSDPLSEVAVLQIKGSNLPVARLGSDAKVPIGSWVIAIGNPFGFQNSVTVGVVSAKGRQLPEPSGKIVLQDLIQTDASINPGNSGGALVDLSGEVIGIPTAMIPQAQGMGFAVSIDSARQVFEKLIKTGKMPWLGVAHHYLQPEEARKLKVPGGTGTVVVEVTPGGPAEQAGIRPGDVILRLAGRPLESEQSLGQAVRAHDAGDRVDAVVWREGREVTIKVRLGAVPQQIGRG